MRTAREIEGLLYQPDWDSPTYPVTPATSALECDRCSPGPESGTWQEAALAAYYYLLSDWEEENQEESRSGSNSSYD